MIIISDCLTKTADEGCRKIAKKLVEYLKKKRKDTFVISYNKSKTELSDMHMKLNKMLLNPKLFKVLREQKGSVLYIPFASNTLSTAIRTYILTRFSKKKIYTLFNIRFSMNKLAKYIFEKSNTAIIALSRESYDFYKKELKNPCYYLKAGVDTKTFHPIEEETKRVLRRKYKIAEDAKIVLHVGHLKAGRNIQTLCEIDEKYQIYLIISSSTEKEENLFKLLKNKKNIRIIEEYVPEIQEYYQMADIYFFPVLQTENCIDSPLSVLEAAACNIPVVTTAYGELKEFIGKSGFTFISSFEKSQLAKALEEGMKNSNKICLEEIFEYDWENSVTFLNDLMNNEKDEKL